MINYDDKNKDELIEYVKENGIYFKYDEDIKIKIIYNKKDDEYLLMYINETIIEVKLQVFKNIDDLIVFYKKYNLINKNKDKILYLKNMILTNI
jgi:broad-specificity NMP kinase